MHGSPPNEKNPALPRSLLLDMYREDELRLLPAIHLQQQGNQEEVWTTWPSNNWNRQPRWLKTDHETGVHQAEAKLPSVSGSLVIPILMPVIYV